MAERERGAAASGVARPGAVSVFGTSLRAWVPVVVFVQSWPCVQGHYVQSSVQRPITPNPLSRDITPNPLSRDSLRPTPCPETHYAQPPVPRLITPNPLYPLCHIHYAQSPVTTLSYPLRPAPCNHSVISATLNPL